MPYRMTQDERDALGEKLDDAMDPIEAAGRGRKTTMTTTNDDDVMTAKEIADYAGCSVEKVWAAYGDGTLHGRNLGGNAGWRSTRRQARAWIEGATEVTQPGTPAKGGA